MRVESKTRLLPVVFLLVLLPHTAVRASDEMKFDESLSEVRSAQDGARQANWILSSRMSDEQKVAALRELLHTGMSISEVKAILGPPSVEYFSCHLEITTACYHDKPGDPSSVWVDYDIKGKAHTIIYFNTTSRQALTIASK
jgi:hypothetical protein